LLPSPPPPEPLLHQQATQGNRDSEVIDLQGAQESPERSEAGSPEGDCLEGDSEIDALLHALSESSSSEDDKGDEIEQPRSKPEGIGGKVKLFGRNGPANNMALLMVACWTLRLPIMYLDLIRSDRSMFSVGGYVAEHPFRLIESYKLPYLEPLHHLPASMTRYLTKHNIQALSPAVRRSCFQRARHGSKMCYDAACADDASFTWHFRPASTEIARMVQNPYARNECCAFVMARRACARWKP